MKIQALSALLSKLLYIRIAEIVGLILGCGVDSAKNQKIIAAPTRRINNRSQISLEVLACNSSRSCSMPGSTSMNTT